MLIGHLESQNEHQFSGLPGYIWEYGSNASNDAISKSACGCLWTRVVKPIGFDNQVLESDYSSQYSEMWWEGPDQTKIFGLLFANWYSNGNEIPSEKAAIAFWKQNWLMWNVTLPQTIY